MAGKSEWKELDDDLAELDRRYEDAVRETGWSPGIDKGRGTAPQPRPMGRPRLGERRIAITLTLSPLAVEMLDSLSDRYHITRGRIVDRLLEGMRASEDPRSEDKPASPRKRKRR